MARNILMACHSSLQTTPVMLRLVGQCSVLDCVNVPQPWAKAYSKTHVGKQTTNCACTMCCNNTMHAIHMLWGEHLYAYIGLEVPPASMLWHGSAIKRSNTKPHDLAP